MNGFDDQIRSEDLEGSQNLLNELFTAVKEEEGTLAGGTKLGLGGDSLEALLKSKVAFGNPYDNLIRLDEALFQNLGIELTVIRKKQMREQFDFYYLTLAVALQPSRGAQFTRLECQLTFGPQGPDEPIVDAVFPTSQWRVLLDWGGGLKLGLGGNLDWQAEASLPTALQHQLPLDVRASVHGTGGLKGFVVIPDFSYQVGRPEITAIGTGAECFWRLDNATLQQTQTVPFAIVFKVPHGTSTVQMTGLVSAEPNFKWLAANIRDVFAHLGDKLKAIFQSERRGRERLPLGDHETWTITLPRGTIAAQA